MVAEGSLLSHFLVEWYHPTLAAAAPLDTASRLEAAASEIRATGIPVRVLVTLTAPTDDITFCVFAAPSAAAVADTCRHAGWPADRVTGGVGAHFSG